MRTLSTCFVTAFAPKLREHSNIYDYATNRKEIRYLAVATAKLEGNHSTICHRGTLAKSLCQQI